MRRLDETSHVDGLLKEESKQEQEVKHRVDDHQLEVKTGIGKRNQDITAYENPTKSKEIG